MRKLLISLLALAAVQLNAQNLELYKQVVRDLSSAEYQGRGYAKDGANKAGKYLQKQFEKAGVKEVIDAAGRNDYYSSESRNRYFRHQYGLSVRYTFAKQSYVGLGTNVAGILNETFSKSYGIEATAGKGEWEWQVMPTATFVHSKGTSRFQISVNTSSGKPSNNRMLPVLNI